MDQVFACKKLKAEFVEDCEFLGGPYTAQFQADDPLTVQVKIVQFGLRTITIESSVDTPIDNLYCVFSRVERLLMMFDGRFMQLRALEFSSSDTASPAQLVSCAQHCMNNRLAYFNSTDFCKYDFHRLLNFWNVITSELYVKWVDLLNELDIVHQVYLYALCGKEQPVDIKCAFLIELAEPLVEVVKSYTQLFSKLKPGDGTSLRRCISDLIKKYGTLVFEKELSGKFDAFSKVLVNSRVRIMHIKKNQKSRFLEGKECVLYAVKMQFLYRKIIFDLLEIDQSEYEKQLKKCVDLWDCWDDVLENLMLKLH